MREDGMREGGMREGGLEEGDSKRALAANRQVCLPLWWWTR